MVPSVSPLILKLAWLTRGFVLFSGMMQPDTVTAKHLKLFSLCADVLNVKEAVLNEDLSSTDRGWVVVFKST